MKGKLASKTGHNRSVPEGIQGLARGDDESGFIENCQGKLARGPVRMSGKEATGKTDLVDQKKAESKA